MFMCNFERVHGIQKLICTMRNQIEANLKIISFSYHHIQIIKISDCLAIYFHKEMHLGE